MSSQKLFQIHSPITQYLYANSGFVDVIMPNNIEFKKNQRCLHPVSQGSMGYAIPADFGCTCGR